MGGLGNQLFIYAAGLAAASASGVDLRIDLTDHRARSDRPPLLQQLGFPGNYVVQPVKKSRGGLVNARLCTYRERSFTYDPAALDVTPGSCMYGYFQSWRYVAPVAEDMRTLLRRAAEPRLEVLQELLAQISKPGSVAVHVRRGDYLHEGARDFHGLAGASYYERAFSVLQRMRQAERVFLFSDSPDEAKNELALEVDVIPVSRPPLEPLDELVLMSFAPAVIMANSSFSWWASWLGDDQTRPVIAPRPWFDDERIDSRDLLMPHWLTVDRR